MARHRRPGRASPARSTSARRTRSIATGSWNRVLESCPQHHPADDCDQRRRTEGFRVRASQRVIRVHRKPRLLRRDLLAPRSLRAARATVGSRRSPRRRACRQDWRSHHKFAELSRAIRNCRRSVDVENHMLASLAEHHLNPLHARRGFGRLWQTLIAAQEFTLFAPIAAVPAS
jgi:hypothetical protein